MTMLKLKQDCSRPKELDEKSHQIELVPYLISGDKVYEDINRRICTVHVSPSRIL